MDKSRRSGIGAGRRSKSGTHKQNSSIPAIVTDIILDEEASAIEDKLV